PATPDTSCSVLRLLLRPPPQSALVPYTTLFRSSPVLSGSGRERDAPHAARPFRHGLIEETLSATTGHSPGQGDPSIDLKPAIARDRKSTRLNSSHVKISYAVFCLKKKTKMMTSG